MEVTEIIGAAMSGERRHLARALTMLEDGRITAQSLPPFSEEDEWRVLGITGAPGVGKSCLVDHLLKRWVEDGHRVAVLAIDPTSPLTGGALLGDRIRMANADTEDAVYVRSIATRKHGGSVPGVVRSMLNLLLSAGWSRCIVETVGSGQGEFRIAAVADRILLVESPGRGDSIQAEKAGVIELADIIAVNKSDLDGAIRTADEIRQALEAGTATLPPIILTSAATGEGMEALAKSIEGVNVRPEGARARAKERLRAAWEQKLLDHPEFSEAVEEMADGNTDLEGALQRLGGSR